MSRLSRFYPTLINHRSRPALDTRAASDNWFSHNQQTNKNKKIYIFSFWVPSEASRSYILSLNVAANFKTKQAHLKAIDTDKNNFREAMLKYFPVAGNEIFFVGSDWTAGAGRYHLVFVTVNMNLVTSITVTNISVVIKLCLLLAHLRKFIRWCRKKYCKNG